MRRLKIWFWKIVAVIWDLRPRLHLPKYKNYPIASTDIADEYEYPDGVTVLYEWDEYDKHWIVFTRP